VIDCVIGNSCTNDSATASIKIHDAFSCAAGGYDTSRCLNKEDQCPANDWLVPIVLGVYTLITQVMMLNLLIAMFRWYILEINPLVLSYRPTADFDAVGLCGIF